MDESRRPLSILRDQLAARNEAFDLDRRIEDGQPTPAAGAPTSLVVTLDAQAAQGLEAIAASLGVHASHLAEQLLREAVSNRYRAPS